LRRYSKEEAATVIDTYFDRADANGDGDVNFAEFAKLYSELKVGSEVVQVESV
jgi:hypothetical protein